MTEELNTPEVSTAPASNEAVRHLSAPPPKPQKGAADWVRDLRMNAAVNKTTVGVETDRVTPELMLATSAKLLGISRRQIEPDPKDSLEFQRVYGPAEYFSEHILRDASRIGRQLLWKATNRGNVDFMNTGALDQHVSDVFNSSKLANMIDGSSPLETVDASFKISRIGEGGIGDVSSAPDEMRLVQPSFLGYIDSVRSPECCSKHHEIMTLCGWVPMADVTVDDTVACYVDGHLEWHKPAKVVHYPYNGTLYAYDDGNLAYQVTPEHRIWCDDGTGWRFVHADDVHGKAVKIKSRGMDALLGDDQDYQLNPAFFDKIQYDDAVHCVTVPGGIFCTRIAGRCAHWTGNSLRVGLDAYMTKHCMKGSDGKLYQEFINARTGKKELVDSVTAARSVITTPDMMKAKTNHIYAVGGKTGVRIVKKSDVDYYLPNMDEAFSTAANLVTNMSGVKEMRLLMGCLHPLTTLTVVDGRNNVSIIYAKDASSASGSLPGADKEHAAKMYGIRTTVAKFPRNRAWFRKIVLCSGRALVTSKDHRWPVLRDGKLTLVNAEKLKDGDQVLRSTFKDLPSRRTFVNNVQITQDLAELLGFIARSGRLVGDKLRIVYTTEHKAQLDLAVSRLQLADAKYYVNGQDQCLGISDKWFIDWVSEHMGFGAESRIPTEILSARPNVSIHFLNAYTADASLVGIDSMEYTWVLDIPSVMQRDGLALLWARMGTDTFYRDSYQGEGRTVMALKLTEYENQTGDCVTDIVKANLPAPSAAIMVDIDIDDNMYAAANGVVTHNSKYPLQAVSIEGREPPLVRNMDMRSGSDIHSKIGRYLGARYADKPGRVTAVRKGAIDVLYDDGTKGRVAMYENFPMNAKGFITNTPQVKAGDTFKKGDLLASSNYTDDKGTMATGTNLRVGWISWHGGTYEDAVVLSESAAKKLTSNTMYSTDLDLDKTVTLGKKNYQSWKPDEFTAEQLAILDDEGIVRSGTILQKGDPMVLAVRTTEPSPGTMGKRVLTDISETWEHDHPGKVTDIVRTRNGVRVLTTVTAPVEVGDKVSGLHGNKGVVSTVLPDDYMPKDKDGKPLEMLLSPLGLISRCYDEQTEFLTRDGWKRGADVLDTDLLYCYDPVDNTWRWDKQLTPMHKFQHKGRMYGGKNRLVDFLVSPGHKVWTKSDYPKAAWKETVIDEIFGKRYYIPCVATMPKAEPLATDFHLPTIPIKFKDTYTNTDDVIYEAGDWAELLGWYLAEGNTTYDEPGRKYRVNIAQSLAARPDNVKHIHELLTRMGFTYHYTEANRQFHIGGKRMAAYMKQFGKCDEKFVPDWLFQQPTYIIRRFLDGLWAGDGHDAIFPNKDGKMVHVHTLGLTSEKLIDQVQILLAMCGESAQKHPIAVKRPGKDKPMWRLVVSTVGRTCRLLRGDDWYCIDDYDGMIYCPSVPSGYIMTRRNGKTICMGNCNAAQLNETLLGKVAHKTGVPETMNPFYEGDLHHDILDKLKKNGLSAEDDFYDPDTGRKIPGIVNGYSYIHKLKHLSESKESARGTDSYATDETPGGSGYTGSKRFGTLETSALVGHCLLGYVRVLTRDGYMPISSIVAGRLPVEVLSYNQKTDRFEYKTVTDWFARSVAQEDLWRLTTNARQDNISNGALRGYHHSLRCTRDHKILTPDRGYVPACELKPGDLVYDRGPVVLDWQMSIIKGTVMGDGYLCKYKNKLGESCASLRVVHGPKQHAYTRWMHEKLSNLCQSEPSLATRTMISPTGYVGSGDQMRMATVSTYEISRLTDRFYIELNGQRHKTVPKGIVEELGYAGIAIWYMDDGSVMRSHKASAHAMMFHTCGFTVDEVEQLRDEMNAFTGLHFSILMKAGKYPILYLKHGPRGIEHPETEIFSERLAPYITEDFRYKLGDNYPTDKPVGTFWQDKQAPDCMVMHGEPCVVTESAPLAEIPQEGYVVYDITVPDNHNFIASGIVVSNSAFDTLLDNKLIRGQSNADFWRSIRTGGIPTIPGEPLVQKKFFAHLQGSGVNVRKTPKGISVFALSNSDVKELAGPREVKTRDTYEARTFRPIDGGLFGQDVFGQDGDRWGYIQLDEPVPNPVMEEPLARLLRMTDKDFVKAVTGKEQVNGIRGASQMKDVLSKVDLEYEAKKAMLEFKNAPASKKDAALKRYTAVEEMRRAGLNPAEYMLDRIPVLPAQYRPVSTHNGLTMVADANYLYAQLLDARDDMRDAKDLPQEYQDKARENLYRTWQELVGLYDPEDIKLRNKNVGGLLKWALGTAPKFSAFQRKVLGGAVDTVGRGVIVPDSRLTIDQIGIPESMALNMMAPFVERKLVQRGYMPVDAMKMVKRQDKTAKDVLNEVVKTHMVEINRAPTLHKFNIMAFEPVLVQGHAIHIHPSVCPGFNADADGDQVNAHVPVSYNAIQEARDKMRPSRNLIAPSNRKIMNKPEKEYMQGLYIATRMGKSTGRPLIFRTYDEAREAYRNGAIDIDTPIRILEQK